MIQENGSDSPLRPFLLCLTVVVNVCFCNAGICQAYLERENALVSANKDIDPATLPPIERASHFHSLHVYFELQRTIMLTIDTRLQPTELGWKRIDELLVPTMTDSPVAPKELLEVIRCNCHQKIRAAPCNVNVERMNCLVHKLAEIVEEYLQ